VLSEFVRKVKSFALARVLMTAIELDLFRHIQKKSLCREDLLDRLGVADSPIVDAFFEVLVNFKILSKEGSRLALAPLGKSVLPAYESIRSWNREMELFYASLADLPQLLRTGRADNSALSNYWAYKKAANRKELSANEVGDYSSVMDASQEQLSKTILDTYDFSGHERIIEFGGGYGRLAIALVEKYAHLKITVADLPAVCDRTRSFVDDAGLGERIKCLPVDFFTDGLPSQSADALMFVRVLHDWNDNDVIELLERTKTCLKSRGTALIIEPMIDDSEAVNPSSVLSSLMVSLLGGRRRSVQEYVGMLKSAGYGEFSCLDCGLSIYRIVFARLEESVV